EAHCLIQLGSLDEAEDLLSVAREKFPENLWCAFYYASVATKKNVWDTALERWKICQQQFPDAPEGYVGESSVLTALKRFPDAEYVLEIARDRFPMNLWAAHHYAAAAA